MNEEIDAARELKKGQEQGLDATQAKRQKLQDEMAATQPLPTVTIRTHGKQPLASQVETASEWESEDLSAQGNTLQRAPSVPVRAGVTSVGRMGTN